MQLIDIFSLIKLIFFLRPLETIQFLTSNFSPWSQDDEVYSSSPHILPNKFSVLKKGMKFNENCFSEK